MPSNPLTQEEINDYAIGRILNPSGYTGLSPYMPQGYFLSTPSSGDGPALWRLFDASFISSGTISPDRLGSGAAGLGNLYLADDGIWKAISIPATPTLHQVTTAGNVTTNAITVGAITGNDGTVAQFKFSSGAAALTPTLAVANTGSGGKFAALVAGTSGSAFIYDSSGFFVIQSQPKSDYTSNNLGSGTAVERFRITSAGNVLINTTTDAGYKLDVNGTVRLGGDTLVKGSSTASNAVGFEVQNSAASVAFQVYNDGQARFLNNVRYYASIIANDYVARNNTMSFDINGYGAQFIGSRTAASAIARGVYFNNTLVAAANNDVLVGLDINPTFTNGTFTGVNNIGLRINGNNINYNASNHKVVFSATTNASTRMYFDSTATGANWNTGISLSASSVPKWTIGGYGSTYDFTFFNEGLTLPGFFIKGSNNNVIIGASVWNPTDAGYKLDVNGTVRIQNNTTINQSGSSPGLTVTSGTNPQIRVLDGTIHTKLQSTSGLSVGLVGTESNHPFSIFVNNSEALRVFTTTNISIGSTVDSGYKLDVNGSISGKILNLVTASDNSYGCVTGYYAGGGMNFFPADKFGNTWFNHFGSGNIYFDTSNEHKFRVNYVDALTIKNSGYIGIGTAYPGYNLEVIGNIGLSGTLVPTAGVSHLGTFTNRFGDLWASGLIVGTTFYGDNHQSASGYLFFKEGGGVEKMRMTPGGNFLIGTTTDTGEKLQVSGTVRASAFAIGATAGWTGIINIPTNPPGQQNIDVQGGIIVNVY